MKAFTTDEKAAINRTFSRDELFKAVELGILQPEHVRQILFNR